MIAIEEITAAEALQSLRGEWTDLCERCPGATPFQTPEWLLAWWNYFGNGNLWTLAARRGGALVGLAPFFLHERTLLLAGTGISDYLDVLIAPGDTGEVLEALLAHLAVRQPLWDGCDFRDLPAHSPMLRQSAIASATVTEDSACPVVSLPASKEKLLAGLGKEFRRNLRRSRQRLASLGEIVFEIADERNVGEHLEALFRLHGARWQERAEAGVLGSPDLQDFHRSVARAFLQKGWLALHALRLDGEVAAVVYAFPFRQRYYAYIGGFEPRLARCSPGALLLERALEDAICRGCQEFDFLRGNEAYKYAWGGRDQKTFRWRAARCA